MRVNHWASVVSAAAALFSGPAACAVDGAVRMDGSLDDWPAGVAARADAHWVYIRFSDPADVTLQSAPVETVIELDVDGDNLTGDAVLHWPLPIAEAPRLGVDVRIHLSPLQDPPGRARAGSGVFAMTYRGERGGGAADAYELGFGFLPTHAADEYEVRFSRAALVSIAGTTKFIRGRVLRVEPAPPGAAAPVEPGRRPGVLARELTGVFQVDLPDAPHDDAPDVFVPAAAEGELRVVSWNVLWATPMLNPLPFARVLRALEPDVLLLQEWDERSYDRPLARPEDIAAWLAEHTGARWGVHRTTDRGVVVASRLPLMPLDPAAADTPGRDVRFAGAVITSPSGKAVVGSAHLKCCGSAGSPEDATRISEASSIAGVVAAAAAVNDAGLVVLGGDFNLVGSRAPLDVMVGMLGRSGLVASPADAVSLAGGAAFTWREAGSPFTPGRLDYVVLAGPGHRPGVARAFVLDASALPRAALSAAGLQPGDTGYSDHLPIVVDIRPGE